MNTIANLVRRDIVQSAQTVVVKIGTNVLSNEDDSLNLSRLESLADQIHRIRQSGRQIAVVSSGAVGAGMGLLKLKNRPKDLPHLQAAAATGQAHLIRLYDDCLRKHGYHAAQILLTANDFKRRLRYLNVRNTIFTLFEYGMVPIINENDTVSVEEIKFGDNDQLAAMVANLLQAPLLIILSVVDGLYEGTPGQPGSRLIPLVEHLDETFMGLAQPTKSSRGRGGMQSKLQAVRMATTVGGNVIIANGTRANVLDEILRGEEIGTLFLAAGAHLPAWKRWIGYTVAPHGRLVLDDGACRAITEQGRSLLAIGIVRVEGDFARGEVVSLVSQTGTELARGLTNYNAHDMRKIAGQRSPRVTEILGEVPYSEVIHRNNLVVTS